MGLTFDSNIEACVEFRIFVEFMLPFLNEDDFNTTNRYLTNLKDVIPNKLKSHPYYISSKIAQICKYQTNNASRPIKKPLKKWLLQK